MPRVRRKDFPDFSKELGQLDRLIRELPTLIGNTAVDFFKDSWDREGFIDSKLERWPRRKRRDTGRALLIKSGDLRRSINFKVYGTRRILIYSDVPYAQAHNEGLGTRVGVRAHTRRVRGKRTKVKAHTRQMNLPKRQFMGPSKLLTKRIEKHIERALDQILD